MMRTSFFAILLATLLCALGAREGYAQGKDCDYLRHQGVLYDGAGKFKEGYDTLRLFVERCAADIHHPSYTWIALLGKLTSEFSGLLSTPNISQDFRTWIQANLYRNKDTDYYCAMVTDPLLSTFQNSEGQATYESVGELLAVIRYLLESGKCPASAPTLNRLYKSASESRRSIWALDMYRQGIDTSKVAYDSSYKSIDDIGLSWLRGPEAEVGASSSRTSSAALIGVSVLNNPFEETLEIAVELGRQTLVTVELYDLLGNKLPLKNANYRLQNEGKHTMTIPSAALPSGSYWLRVTTDHGDTKTVKVIKE